MVNITPSDVSGLQQKHAASVQLLKDVVEKNFPDLKNKQELPDGTIVDDLFYLRYVLSSKTPLTTLNEVEDSKTLKDVSEGLRWRNGENLKNLSSTDEIEMMKVLPLLKTGELPNSFPVLYLPVKDVDMSLITKNQGNKSFEERLMNQILFQKAAIFKELDEKTRESGKLVKAVVIYDLNGLSYSDIYKLAGFFKLMSSHGKTFKKLFPQYTEVTLIVNVRAASLLKRFLTSSKQKIISVDEVEAVVGSLDSLPTAIGGQFVWPKTEDDWRSVIAGRSLKEVEDEVVEVAMTLRRTDSNVEKKKGSNKKIDLTELERELITMKKNKLFSIDVLEPNQKVNLFFTNARKKKANILVVIKEEDGSYTNSAVLPSGCGYITLNMKTKGEVLLAYLDTKKAKGFNSDLENASLKRNPAHRVFRFTKKRLFPVKQQKHKLKKNKMEMYRDLGRVNELSRAKDLQDLGLTQLDKVMFRFEISDAVVCGALGGERDINESELSEFKKAKDVSDVQSEPEPLKDYDGRSLCSQDTFTQQPSFLFTAANILSNGW